MVVHSRDDCIVMAIPRHHGDFGFEVAFLFAHWLNSKQKKKIKRFQLQNILHAAPPKKYTKHLMDSLAELSKKIEDFPQFIVHLAQGNNLPAGGFTYAMFHQAVH